METEEKIILVTFQIFLLVSLSFAMSYIFHDYNKDNLSIYEEGNFIKKARTVILGYLGSNLVSAQTALWTCPVNTNGSFCQEYLSSQCDENCEVDCLPARASQTSTCQLGTCIYDSGVSCDANTPKLRCEDVEYGIGGVWDSRAPSEIPQCQKGCCFLGSNTQFVTSAQCNARADSLGIELDGTLNKFDSSINSELECVLKSNPLAEGACVYSEEVEPGKYDCDFLTKQNCLNSGGDFYESTLCSNPELNTICERQDSTSCIVGKDEVYWMDSCGNRENIYEGGSGAARERSWNNGKILSKEESCVLGNADDVVDNQRSCGNCNYLGGTVCGSPGANDQRAYEGDFVCKDLSCTFTNEFGQTETRKHGESWCSLDGQTGVQGDGNEQRSVDVPGSSHYRNVCLEGEVRIEPCSSGRREVCVQEDNKEADFSSAACRINQWARCYDMNSNPESLARCEEITDCVIKTVDLTSGGNDNFKFSLCVPRYPPGFELRPDLDSYGSLSGQYKSDAEIACSLASVQCKKITIKKIFGGKKQINGKCDSAEFTETMNNLCMSLGDCGGSVNVEGEYTDYGYNVVNAPELGARYISALKKLSDAVKGQSAESLSEDEIASLYGIDTGDAEYNFDSSMLDLVGQFGGLAGVTLAYGVHAGWLNVLLTTNALPAGVAGPPAPVYLSSYASAAAGALVGASIVSLLLKYSGIGAGLPEELQYALIVGGAVAGAILSFNFLGPGVAAGWLTFAWVLGAFIVAFIIIGWLLGWGKKKVKTITFDCKPWQAPTGGASCELCGADGLPCNEYKCESLGQTCEFVNKGTTEEACIDVSPNDASPPVISSDSDVLEEGYSYQSESDLGFEVKGPTSDGCLPVYTPVTFGIKLDEVGQCKFENSAGIKFDDMESYFGNSNLFRAKHSMTLSIPNLAALQDEGINPNARADFDLYIRCQDRSGNANTRDYAISFCVSPEEDLTPPVISRFNPTSNGYVAYGSESKTVNFYVNEPGECRWDLQDVDFDLMLNDASCVQDVESGTIYGYACETELPISSEENKFYFRCKDQPWLEESNPDNLERNKNSESFEYVLRKSTTELSIDEIRPSGETILGGNVASVNIELVAETSGGAPNTPVNCYFDFGNNGNYVKFFRTGANTHIQPLNLYFDSYEVGVRCEDGAGNIAVGETSFNVELDSEGPRITRFYLLNNLLNVITNEPAECSYSLENCGFEFSEGNPMSGFDYTHTTSFDSRLTHYVKCQDVYDSIGSCVAISRGIV